MMGRQSKDLSLFTYSVNLDKRVHPDHPLRQVNHVLDLNFVYDKVGKFYGKNGNTSVDPVVIVKMMLLLFLDNIPSERELVKILPARLDYLWFLGFSLDDEIPNHSVLSKARAKWGKEVFDAIFQNTIFQCVQAGLVDGAKIHMDSSLIKANASKNSVVVISPEMAQALREVSAEQSAKLDEPITEGVNATRISKTDPDATLACKPGVATQLSYKSHRVVDDKEGVITAVATTTGIASDSQQLKQLVKDHQSNTDKKVEVVVGDGHYGTAEAYRFCEENKIKAHLRQVESHNKKIPSSEFTFESEFNRYRCPQGHYLYYHNFKKDDQLIEYKIEDANHCAKCPLRSQCTQSKHGRSISVPLFAEIVQGAKIQSQSPEALADLKRRQHLMERSFADAANNHGFKRARWRRIWRQEIQDLMIAAVQNIRILLRKVRTSTSPACEQTVLGKIGSILTSWDGFLGLMRRSLVPQNIH